ncbi:MAG: chromate transporter, partial [Christensenellaceae bacterium]
MIGLFTIGGGYAMIPLITQEVSKWIDLTMLSNFIGISESTPGPFAVNIATFIGFETSGILGAFFATLGVVLPSFIIILVISKYYEKFKNNFYVVSAF